MGPNRVVRTSIPIGIDVCRASHAGMPARHDYGDSVKAKCQSREGNLAIPRRTRRCAEASQRAESSAGLHFHRTGSFVGPLTLTLRLW
jgi:hypothetical protein